MSSFYVESTSWPFNAFGEHGTVSNRGTEVVRFTSKRKAQAKLRNLEDRTSGSYKLVNAEEEDENRRLARAKLEQQNMEMGLRPDGLQRGY